MLRSLILGTVTAATLSFAPDAHAVIVQGPTFSGNECGGAGGFPNCYATTTGTNQGGPGSPTIYKDNFGGSPEFGSFSSIDGSEFSINFDSGANTLSFTYTPGTNDPEIHYFVVNQADTSVLFYDTTSPILTDTVDLTTLFPSNPGYSHITFFDTGSGGGGGGGTPTSTPEPMSLALLGVGLVGFGAVRKLVRRA
jgi:hypothetical protein